MRTFIAALAIVLVPAAPALAAPALADPPKNVTSGDYHGVLETEWVRAACATNEGGAKCVIRFPEGARRFELTHYIDGKLLGREVGFVDKAEHRASPAPFRRTASMLGGVIINCKNRGQVAKCSIDYPAGTEDISTTTYVRGWNYGGLRTDGLELL